MNNRVVLALLLGNLRDKSSLAEENLSPLELTELYHSLKKNEGDVTSIKEKIILHKNISSGSLNALYFEEDNLKLKDKIFYSCLQKSSTIASPFIFNLLINKNHPLSLRSKIPLFALAFLLLINLSSALFGLKFFLFSILASNVFWVLTKGLTASWVKKTYNYLETCFCAIFFVSIVFLILLILPGIVLNYIIFDQSDLEERYSYYDYY